MNCNSLIYLEVDKKYWGQSTHIDLYDCDSRLLGDGEKLKEFLRRLCVEIKMKAHGEPIIDRFGDAELEGFSGMQFIETSSITVHLDEIDGRAFIDVFSCKLFDEKKAIEFSKKYYKAKRAEHTNILRG